MSATHGDCKNSNSGKHNGYDCPTVTADPGPVVTSSPGPVVTDPGPIYVS